VLPFVVSPDVLLVYLALIADRGCCRSRQQIMAEVEPSLRALEEILLCENLPRTAGIPPLPSTSPLIQSAVVDNPFVELNLSQTGATPISRRKLLTRSIGGPTTVSVSNGCASLMSFKHLSALFTRVTGSAAATMNRGAFGVSASAGNG